MSWKWVQSPASLCVCLSHWKQKPEYLLYGAEREDIFSIGAGSWRVFWNHKIGGVQSIGGITVLDLGPVEGYVTFCLFEYTATQFYARSSLVSPFKVSYLCSCFYIFHILSSFDILPTAFILKISAHSLKIRRAITCTQKSHLIAVEYYRFPSFALL